MALSNDVVTRAVFGGKFAQQGEYIRELQEVFRLLGGFCLVDLFPSSRLVRWLSSGERHMKTSYGCIQRIIADVIEERKGTRASDAGSSTAGEEDMLEVLLRLQQEDSLKFPLTTETMAAVLFDIFAGGTETTANILSWAMSELMHSPNTMAKAQQEVREALGKDRAIITNSDHVELHYVWMVIMEVLRLHPPGPLVPRMAREECTVMGYDIPKGTSVYINVFAISRDPRYWNNPEEFRPERFENNHLNYKGTHFEFIPFGTGRRQCPGIQFSSSLIEMALTNLLYHFDWMLPSGIDLASFDMSEKFGLAVSKRYDLQLRAIPHVV
uniref:Cytochrome P450 71D11 n=1 Tax=Aegilops tauschii subsp. strangulata TaxID=200361 RepID=A0A453A7E9_AEGTS